MSYHRGLTEVLPSHVGPFTYGWVTANPRTIGTSNPASATYSDGSNAAVYFPLLIRTACPVKRMFWANGSTVASTYMIEAAIYGDNGYKPGSLITSCGPVPQGTATQVQYAAPGIKATVVTENGSDSNLDTYSTASVTLRPGYVYFLSIENAHNTSAPAASTVQTNGGAVSFTSRQTVQYSAGVERISLWTATTSSEVTAAIDIAFGSSSGVQGCSWSLLELRNVDPSTNDGIVQSATNTGTSSAPSATLSSFASADNGTFMIVGGSSNTGVSSWSGLTEVTDRVRSAPASTLATAYTAVNDTAPDATMTSQDWGAIAVEVDRKSDTSIVLPPGLYWLAVHNSNTSSTMFRSAMSNISSAWDATRGFTQTSLTAGLPATATGAESANIYYILFGFATTASP